MNVNGRSNLFIAFYCGASLLLSLVSGQQKFLPPTNGTCACLDQNLTYTCTVEGTGATVWNGTAFTCAQNRIVLRNEAISGGTAIGSCNDGNIVAQGVDVRENRYYTSELVANVSGELSGSTIGCQLSSGGLTPIGSAQVNVITGPYQPIPVVTLAQANANTLRFTWPSVDPNCPSVSYESITSGCGTCSTTTDPATGVATCTGLQLGSMCTFSVQSVICGFTGVPSSSLAVHLQVPDPPQVSIIPVYSADPNILNRLSITVDQQSTQDVTDSLFGAITEYTMSYSGGIQRNTSCTDNQCKYEVRGPFHDCGTSTVSVMNITVSASNVFGQGEASMPLIFGCTNQFVQVNYTSSVIVCTYLNAMDTGVKSCTVVYGPCDQELDSDNRRTSENSTVDRPNDIELQLDPSIADLDCFMYVVRASNVTYTVIVEGTRSTQSGSTSPAVIIAATVVSIVILFLMAMVVVIITPIIIIRRKQALAISKKVDEHEEEHNTHRVFPQMLEESDGHKAKKTRWKGRCPRRSTKQRQK